MKPTDKQKCIAEQAVYGNLRAIVNNHFNADLIFRIDINGVTLKYSNGEYPLADMSTVKPILRPLSDLYKTTTHKVYNDDKPFTPQHQIDILELGSYSICLGQAHLRPCRETAENDLLHQWHFDTRNLIATGEAIDVNTLDVNPYSV